MTRLSILRVQRGATYDTALFISKSLAAFTVPAGPDTGVGLYSQHDVIADGGASCYITQSSAASGRTDCSWNNTNAWQTCPTSPLCLWEQGPGALALGIPASVAGGNGTGAGGPNGGGAPSVPPYRCAQAPCAPLAPGALHE